MIGLYGAVWLRGRGGVARKPSPQSSPARASAGRTPLPRPIPEFRASPHSQYLPRHASGTRPLSLLSLGGAPASVRPLHPSLPSPGDTQHLSSRHGDLRPRHPSLPGARDTATEQTAGAVVTDNNGN